MRTKADYETLLFLIDVCDPSWRLTHDGLIITGTLISFVTLISPFLSIAPVVMKKQKVRD